MAGHYIQIEDLECRRYSRRWKTRILLTACVLISFGVALHIFSWSGLWPVLFIVNRPVAASLVAHDQKSSSALALIGFKDGKHVMLTSARSSLPRLQMRSLAFRTPLTGRHIRAECSSAPEAATNETSTAKAAIWALRWYKKNLSPLLPPGCRFLPTCSEYARQAFEQYSPEQAAVLTAWRLLRCNPLHVPGFGYGIDDPTWPPPSYWSGTGWSEKSAKQVLEDAARSIKFGEEINSTSNFTSKLT
eukprot:gnl/MRDRNA2_/MRDRNA2_196783_c0_seq1.p1 gnl/MRDRNA2_/MRDRNA2_196783_c0~~gnl/MRDRNA2_/MRDRNA2_196783_c0_seq1.p1  ORF type:complete len:258 (-),score=18.87 gnl/MRDRNA2_/MRDRNA2_196783_c0_seq1:7-744(-)